MNLSDYKSKDKQREITCTVYNDFVELAIFDNTFDNRIYLTLDEFNKLTKVVFVAKDEVEDIVC